MPGVVPKLTCVCGAEVSMELVGEQYQYTWKGTCKCCSIEWFADYEQYQGDL
jgi:hypothetical protein